MIETVVESIRVSLVTQHRVVILKEVHGERHLPIWIGAYEAEAIAMELQGVSAARPLPYDLMKSVIVDMGGAVDRIVVTDLSQDVFYARIVIQQNGRSVEVDSRPSDAIALAVRQYRHRRPLRLPGTRRFRRGRAMGAIRRRMARFKPGGWCPCRARGVV